jgi:hypothetical protein
MKSIDVSQQKSISGGAHYWPFVSAYLGKVGNRVWERNWSFGHWYSGWMYWGWAVGPVHTYYGSLACYC